MTMLHFDPAGAFQHIGKRPSSLAPVHEFVGLAVNTSGPALTLPTHAAPITSGADKGVKHLLLMFTQHNTTNIGGVPPSLPSGAGWTSIFSGVLTGAQEGIHVGCKYAASASESIGTIDSTINRYGAASFRVRPAPTDPLDLFNIAGIVTDSDATADTTADWVGLTLAGAQSIIIGIMASNISGGTGQHVVRSDLINSGIYINGNGSFGFSAPTASWSATTTTMGASCRTYNVGIEFRNPGEL